MAPTFFCLSEEIGASGTHHIHVYVIFPTPRRFSTLQRRFPTAHIETAYGTAQENVDYVKKEGVYADKHNTSVPGTYYESGTMPISKDAEYDLILDMLKEGSSVAEVIVTYPKLMYRAQQLEKLREELNSQRYGIEDRDVEVKMLIVDDHSDAYAYVKRQHHGKICRITAYRDPMSFDTYHGEDIILFDNFCGQIRAQELINYLGTHPVTLPARFQDRNACYTHVYITTRSKYPYSNLKDRALLEHYIDDWVDLRRE